MTYDLLIALATFAFVSSVTPGPNNIMLMASGANFGFLRTVPHMLGVSLGAGLMFALIGLGLGQIFDAYPTSRLALTLISSCYLLFLAWKIANAAPPRGGDATGKPLTFLQAAAFQWVNPKAWWMGTHAVTTFSPESAAWIAALWVAGVFALVNLPTITVWITIGTQIKRLLGRPRLLRGFNWTMAALLVATLWPIIQPLFAP